jgi:hypothetical protein
VHRSGRLCSEWEAKYSQKYDVVGTLKPGSVLQLSTTAKTNSSLEPEPTEPEPEPEQLQPQPERSTAQPAGTSQRMTEVAAAANRARIERLEDQTVLSYYAGKQEMKVVDMYGRGRAAAWAAEMSTRPPETSSQLATDDRAARPAPNSTGQGQGENDQQASTRPTQIRGGDLLRIAGFTDATQYEGRVGVATGRRNESTGRFGIAIPMANGAEGTLMVPPEFICRHAGPRDSSAPEDAVEFLNAGTAALKMAEAAQNRTQRRAWLRRAVMW